MVYTKYLLQNPAVGSAARSGRHYRNILKSLNPHCVTPMRGSTTSQLVRDLFRFGPLHTDDFSITLAAGIGVLVILELEKPLWRRMFGKRSKTRLNDRA